MKTVLVLILFAMLTGCAGFSAIKSGVATHGAQIADETRIAAEWTLCDAITIGAWQRAYGSQPEKREGWAKLCSKPAATPATP